MPSVRIDNTRGHLYCYLAEGTNPLAVHAVDAALKFYEPGYRFSKLYKQWIKDPETGEKRRKWDGVTHMLSPKWLRFPTGLLSRVRTTLEDLGYEVVLAHPRPTYHIAVVPLEDPLYNGDRLRPDQLDAGYAFLNARPQRGIIRVATGGGKTWLIAALARALGKNSFGLIHGNVLLLQTYGDLRGKDDKPGLLHPDLVGLIGTGEFDPRLITLASVDTIYSRIRHEDPAVLEYLRTVGFVWCDETHRASATTWVRVLQRIPTVLRLGLSATPLKKESASDIRLEAWTGPLLYEISPAAMQEQKLLAPARLTLLEVNFPEDNYNLLWKDAQRVLIFEHEDRNRAIADAAIKRAKEGKKVFLFAGNNLAYAHRLHDLIAEDYPGVELATGRMPTWHNQEALRDLGRGVVSIVISTVIFDEGINLPELNVVILANAGRSYVKLMQRVGRGLRLKEGGGELEVIDFLDLTNRFLKRHSNARLATYIEEGIFGDVQVQRI